MVKKKEREKRKGKKIRLEEYVKGAQDQQDCEEDDWQKQQLALEGIASIRTKRKVSKRQTFIKRLEQAQERALKTKSAIGKKKRKPLSKALQDFSELQTTLLNEDLSSRKKLPKAKSSAAKCKILVSEKERLSAVVAHPAFQFNPLKAIQNHLKQTLPSENPRPHKTRTTLTPQQKKQLEYRKKMAKQSQDKMME